MAIIYCSTRIIFICTLAAVMVFLVISMQYLRHKHRNRKIRPNLLDTRALIDEQRYTPLTETPQPTIQSPSLEAKKNKVHMPFSAQKENSQTLNQTKLRYVLLWTSGETVPFIYMKNGQEVFIERQCKYKNCFVTSDKGYFRNFNQFDVIVFHGPEVIHMLPSELPINRSLHQKFVFASIESASYYPICLDNYNNYFNWTWTYKLSSDSRWGYIVVRDINGDVIGPKKDMNWITEEDMKPVSDELKSLLKRKSKLVAWFVSNCKTRSHREKFVKSLESILQYYYDSTIDVYGECGTLKCPLEYKDECNKLIEQHYFFYLAFENAFSEDYVTEKVLHGLKYNAVPIVFGGANYSRFLPPGSYLNALELGVERLAAKMYELMIDQEKYANFFKWKNHYSFHSRDEVPETDDYCSICALINDEDKIKKNTLYEGLQKWWNPPNVACQR